MTMPITRTGLAWDCNTLKTAASVSIASAVDTQPAVLYLSSTARRTSLGAEI